jgi:hypothetical protein
MRLRHWKRLWVKDRSATARVDVKGTKEKRKGRRKERRKGRGRGRRERKEYAPRTSDPATVERDGDHAVAFSGLRFVCDGRNGVDAVLSVGVVRSEAWGKPELEAVSRRALVCVHRE